MAKKELNEINQRLNQKVKWTFTRPKNASKITSKLIEIKEKNKEELKSLKIEKNDEEISSTPPTENKDDHKTIVKTADITDQCDNEKYEKNVEEKKHTNIIVEKPPEAQKIQGTFFIEIHFLI